jgi:hypothetical protein
MYSAKIKDVDEDIDDIMNDMSKMFEPPSKKICNDDHAYTFIVDVINAVDINNYNVKWIIENRRKLKEVDMPYDIIMIKIVEKMVNYFLKIENIRCKSFLEKNNCVLNIYYKLVSYMKKFDLTVKMSHYQLGIGSYTSLVNIPHTLVIAANNECIRYDAQNIVSQINKIYATRNENNTLTYNIVYHMRYHMQ